MKRNLLAIAIPALLIASAANASIEIWNKDGNKLNVNGRIYALNYIGDRDNGIDGEGDQTTARIGFTGETQVTDWLSGYGRAEWETNTGKDSFKETRYAFAGLKFGHYGSFDYGRNDGVLKALTAYTDVLPEWGGDAADNNFYALSARTKAVATYRNTDFFGLVDGLSFALQYADNGDNSDNSEDKHGISKKDNDSPEAYGANVQWTIFNSGVTIGGGYARTSGERDLQTWAGGVKYDANNLYLGALYIQTKQDKYTGNGEYKYQGYEFVAQYGIDFEVGRLIPSLAYVQHKDKSSDTGYGGDYLMKYVSVGFEYQFNKNLTAVLDYKINLLDDDDAGPLRAASYDRINSSYDRGIASGSTDDVLALGLIYQF